MKTKKIIGLFIPPAYDRSYPPLGTATLVGFLISKGVKASQEDLNVLYFDYIKKNKLERILTPEFREEKIRRKVYYYKILQYKGAFESLSYWFENNPGSSFAFTERLLSSKVLFRYIVDDKENSFVNFFHKEVLPKIRKENYPIIGFSITSPSQVVASFTFGYFIKKYFPRIKIVIGGQWASFYREELQKRADFDNFYDTIIYFEGETPLYNLIDSIEHNKPLSEVPNLIYRDNGRWRYSNSVSDEDMDKLPPPDFDGLPLEKYLGSNKDMSLTFETSRGCYWNRCIFCIDLPFPKPRYREKSPDLVLRDIKGLIKKYKANHLIISNATFSPWQMREVSKRILKERIKISWWTMARFDEEFDRETLELAKQAGCSMIGFGLESMNQRVLDFLDKGTEVDIIKRIIKDAGELKIGMYFQAMIGLPSETSEEAMDTVGFLLRNRDAIERDATFNIYYLIPKNRVFLNPEKFGIKMMKSQRLPFRYFYPFEHITGNIDRKKASKIISLYQNAVRKIREEKIQNEKRNR
jgi:radical SAM superfamily enzyme YgiQ (UPF0313 family)